MLDCAEAGDEIKLGFCERKALRRTTMKVNRKQRAFASVERHLGNVHSGGNGAKIGRGAQPRPASATDVEKPLALPRLKVPRQSTEMMGDLGLETRVAVVNPIVVVADRSTQQTLFFSHRFV